MNYIQNYVIEGMLDILPPYFVIYKNKAFINKPRNKENLYSKTLLHPKTIGIKWQLDVKYVPKHTKATPNYTNG